MKFRWVFLFFVSVRLFAQSTETCVLHFHQTSLKSALAVIEKKFEIRYNYLDSIIVHKKISLPKRSYTIQQLHTEIAKQHGLQFQPIDARYYSITLQNKDETHLKIENLSEVIVNGYLNKGIYRLSDKTTLIPKNFDLIAGVTDTDVLLTLQQLPGVISPYETASGLHVRGGNIDQNLVLWDGIRLYHPGHLFGMISAVNPYITNKVNFYFKGTPAQFGESLSSVVDIQTSEKILDKAQFSTGINGLNVDVSADIPVVNHKLAVAFSTRKSFTEIWQSPTFNQYAEKVFQNTDFKSFNNDNSFGFFDISGKINFKPRAKTQISYSQLLIQNHLDFTQNHVQPTLKNDQLNINNSGVSIAWKEQWNEHWQHQLAYSFSDYYFDYRNQTDSLQKYVRFSKYNTLKNNGLTFNLQYYFDKYYFLEAGYQYTDYQVAHRFIAATNNYSLTLDQANASQFLQNGYVQLTLQPKNWFLQTGLRSNFYNWSDNQYIEPRLTVQYRLQPSWTVQISYEQKSQILHQIQESVTHDLSLENYVWVLSDQENYPTVKAAQYTAGSTFQYRNWLLDVDYYHKSIEPINTLLYGFFNKFDTQFHQGKGYSEGFDVLLQKKTPRWKMAVTYSFLNAAVQYDQLNNQQYFPINSEIKHHLMLSYFRKWNQFSVAVNWNWHTGKPYSLLNSQNQIISFNSERLPDYHRLDISGKYDFTTQHQAIFSVGFSLLNVYLQNNLLSREYQRKYGSLSTTFNNEFKQVDYYSIGFTPNVFLRFSF